MPIIGEWPCCNKSLWIEFNESGDSLFSGRGKMLLKNCPHCGTKCWHYLSSTTPDSWTDKEFRKEYDVDEETGSVTKKSDQADAPAPESGEGT